MQPEAGPAIQQDQRRRTVQPNIEIDGAHARVGAGVHLARKHEVQVGESEDAALPGLVAAQLEHRRARLVTQLFAIANAHHCRRRPNLHHEDVRREYENSEEELSPCQREGIGQLQHLYHQFDEGLFRPSARTGFVDVAW